MGKVEDHHDHIHHKGDRRSKRFAQTLEGKTASVPDVPDVRWEQLLVYFLYRHFLTAWEDGDVGSKAGFAVLSVRLLRCLKGLYPEMELSELARMYSAEIEYSTENLDILFEELL